MGAHLGTITTSEQSALCRPRNNAESGVHSPRRRTAPIAGYLEPGFRCLRRSRRSAWAPSRTRYLESVRRGVWAAPVASRDRRPLQAGRCGAALVRAPVVTPGPACYHRPARTPAFLWCSSTALGRRCVEPVDSGGLFSPRCRRHISVSLRAGAPRRVVWHLPKRRARRLPYIGRRDDSSRRAHAKSTHVVAVSGVYVATSHDVLPRS
jgi:hypothetical protein